MIAEWIPVLVTALSIGGAAAVYLYQRRIDHRHALVSLRQDAYRNYLNAFLAMSDSPEYNKEVTVAHYKSKLELLVVGSDVVIQRVGDLSRFYDKTNGDRFNRDVQETRRLVAEVCSAMRADCFEKTNLSIDEIKAVVPIA